MIRTRKNRTRYNKSLSESASGNDWCSVALNIYDELWKYHFEKVAKQSAQFNELDIKYGLDLVCDDFPVYREAADVAERDGLKDNFVQWLTYFLINRAEFEGYNVKQIAKPERLTEAHVDRPYYMVGPVNKDKAYQIRDEVYNHFIGDNYAKTKITIEDVTEYILDKYGVDSTGIAEEIMYALGVDETKRLRRANNGRAPYLTIESKKNYGRRLTEKRSFHDSFDTVMSCYNRLCQEKNLDQVDYKLSRISFLGKQGDKDKKLDLVLAYVAVTKVPLNEEFLKAAAKYSYEKRIIPELPKEEQEKAKLSTFGVSHCIQVKENTYETLIAKVPASEKQEETLARLTKVLAHREYKKEEPTSNDKNLDIVDVRKEKPKNYDNDDPYKPSKPVPGETKTTEIKTGEIVGGFADAIAKGAMNPTSASDNKNKYFTIE